MDMQDLQSYISLMQPTWEVLPERRVLRSYLQDMSNPAFPIREMIDIDLSLADTPPALERFMLLRQNKSLRAHVRALLAKVQ